MDPSLGNPQSSVDNLVAALESVERAQTAPEEHSREEGFKPRPLPEAAAASEVGEADGKVPDLLQLSLKFLDIRKTFDEESLRALRLTSRAVRDLVDGAGALAILKFKDSAWEGDARETHFSEFLGNTRAIQRAEAIEIYRPISSQEANNFLHREPPKLKALLLGRVKEGAEVILHGRFPHLTSLFLNFRFTICPWDLLATAPWPLQKLTLCCTPNNAAGLVALLNNFPNLRMLYFDGISFSGADVVPAISPTSLTKLEVLHLVDVRGMADLFDEKVHLPSLHTLIFGSHGNIFDSAIRFPWVKQLRTLVVEGTLSPSSFQALAFALSGGALEELTIVLSSDAINDWRHINLPNLVMVNLKLFFRFGDLIVENFDLFEWFSTATLPMLQSAIISRCDTGNLEDVSSTNGIDTFAEKFPQLRSLEIDRMNVSPAVIRHLFLKVVPQLEELTLRPRRFFKAEDVIPDMLGVQVSTTEMKTTTKKWPRLKALHLGSNEILGWEEELSSQTHFFVAVLKELIGAAQHCPMLNCLDMRMYISLPFLENKSEDKDIEEMQSLADEIITARAWPLMKTFQCGKLSLLPSLHEYWPQAEFNSL